MKKLILLGAVLVAALFFLGCHKTVSPWGDVKFTDVPVSTVAPTTEGDATLRLIPTGTDESGFDSTRQNGFVSDAGGVQPDMILTVPPSTKPTHIAIKRKPATAGQVAKETLSNAPKYVVRSDGPVQAEQPKKSVWWRWALLIVFLLVAALAIAEKVGTKFFSWSPVSILKGFFR